MEFKNFISPTSDDIRVASTSGHIVTITSELTPVPEVLWSLAYASGALSEDMKVNKVSDYIAEKKKEQEDIKLKERQAIKEILLQAKENPVVNFNADGSPSARKIMALYGSPVKKDLIDDVWNEIVKEEGV